MLGARFKQLPYEAGLFLFQLGDLVRLVTHLLPHTENSVRYCQRVDLVTANHGIFNMMD